MRLSLNHEGGAIVWPATCITSSSSLYRSKATDMNFKKSGETSKSSSTTTTHPYFLQSEFTPSTIDLARPKLLSRSTIVAEKESPFSSQDFPNFFYFETFRFLGQERLSKRKSQILLSSDNYKGHLMLFQYDEDD